MERRSFMNNLLQIVGGCVAVLAAGTLLSMPVNGQQEPEHGGVIVLDDCDPVYHHKETYGDNLTFLDGSGKLRQRISGFNICQEIGSPHRIAVDAGRKRVWVTETVGRRLLQYDLEGKELLAVRDIQAVALAVDSATGNLWVARSTGRIGEGSTEVYDATGRRLATHDFRGFDISYDKKSKAFWLVEQQLLKVTLEGKVLVRKDIAKWCAVSVAVDQKTGAVWVLRRAVEPPNKDDGNHLLGFDNDGKLLHTIPLDDRTPIRVAVDSRDGAVWVTNAGKSVLRFSSGGQMEAEYKFPALTVEVGRASGTAWVVTQEEILKIDREGKVHGRTKHKAKTSMAWIASY